MTGRIAIVAALVVGLSLPATTLAQKKSSRDCPQPSASPGTSARSAPDQIMREVTAVDRTTNTVTLRMSDGSTQQFRANKETVDDLKVGNRIEAKKRTPEC